MGCEIDGTNEILCNKGVAVALKSGIACNPGLGLACNPGLDIYKEFLEGYKKRHFFKENGDFDFTTIVAYTTDILKKHGLKNVASIQNVAGIVIYPVEYFCPKNYSTGKTIITENTYSIHHFSASWKTQEEKYILFLKRKYYLLPKFIAIRLALLKTSIKFKGLHFTIKKCFKTILREIRNI